VTDVSVLRNSVTHDRTSGMHLMSGRRTVWRGQSLPKNTATFIILSGCLTDNIGQVAHIYFAYSRAFAVLLNDLICRAVRVKP